MCAVLLCCLLVYRCRHGPRFCKRSYAERAASVVFSIIGGMAGAILGGRMGDRFGLPKVVVGFFAAAALSIALIGFNPAPGLLFALVFVAGATTIGTQILLYASVAQLYNLSVRGAGLGWASGVGRIGAIVGRPWGRAAGSNCLGRTPIFAIRAACPPWRWWFALATYGPRPAQLARRLGVHWRAVPRAAPFSLESPPCPIGPADPPPSLPHRRRAGDSPGLPSATRWEQPADGGPRSPICHDFRSCAMTPGPRCPSPRPAHALANRGHLIALWDRCPPAAISAVCPSAG